MATKFNPRAGHPEKTYEYIAHQIEREDNLYQARLATCVVVNLGLGAAVASQVSGSINIKTYIIVAGCCAIGLLVTEGIRLAIKAGKIQNEYLWQCFAKLNRACGGRFPYPHYHSPPTKLDAVLTKFTPITLVFELIWIGTFLFVTFALFCPL